MRHVVSALILGMVASLGAFAPGHVPTVAGATPTGPKVVLVVGATHGSTATYRTRMDAAYAEAIKHTDNVVKVYSPNATWARVKAAMQGASVVVYMGHGNGFPSPYRTTPWPYSQNGFGLNKVENEGDHNNVYYGEHYIGNEVKLAPNAVVLLNHLCYASGNSEPGHAEPTQSVARQRVDNYAAGFLKAGARAVISDGHMGPIYYLKSLFTTSQSIDELWRKAPNFQNHVLGFTSVRSPGYTAQMDPTTTTSGYYRAIVGRVDLRTTDVTGATSPDTDGDPASFAVPGNAAVAVDGASVFADASLTPDATTGAPVATLPLETRVRVLAATTSPTGSPVLQIETHDGTAAGFMAAADLVPRDSTAPVVHDLRTNGTVFSPNRDGRQDLITVSGVLSETAWWRVRFWRDGTMMWSGSGEGTTISATWGGSKDGAVAPDGTYHWTLETRDGWLNVGAARAGDVRIDTVAPVLGGISLAAIAPAATLTPNADGRYDTVAVGWQIDEAGAVDVGIRNSAGTVVRSFSTTAKAGPGSSTWDGKSNSGVVVPDGLYTIRLVPRDAGGNVGASQERTVAVFTALSHVTASVARFYPHDNDRFAPSTRLSFTLTRPATVTWRVTKLDGTPVLTRHAAVALPAGTHSFVWNGTDSSGRQVPTGMYVSAVHASTGGLAALQKTWIDVNAFSIKVSDMTPARGQTVTFDATTAEPVSGKVVLHVTQPGLATWAVAMSKVSAYGYRATVKLRSSSTGTMSVRVSALDADGRWQRTYLSLPLQ